MDAAHECEASRGTGVEREKQGNSSSRHRGTKVRGRRAAACSAAAAAVTSILLVLTVGAIYMPSRGGISIINDAGETHPDDADGLGAMVGISASSSMLGVSPPSWAASHDHRDPDRRKLLLRGQMPGKPRLGGANAPAMAKRPPGEPAMLNEYNKEPLDWIDLDDVQEGYLWIPVAVDRFDPSTTDPLVKMCQVNYAKYSAAPWLLPMGGLLSLNSGCAEIDRDTVQIVRMSVLERTLQERPEMVAEPTGFIFHETRCGSTLVANMLASVESNVMWSESTGPWKVMHTCPKCSKTQIVPWLSTVMRAMTRSARHDHFYFKFQSSEDIQAVTTAFPNVPWIFIFREPVEVMMSRLGAQRIGMAGMEKEVEARVVKGMAAGASRGKQKLTKEATTAQQLANLCRKAIQAYEARPDNAMMVEYPHIPEAIFETVLPQHFRVDVPPQDHERMMNTTRVYSKVASFAKGSPDSKFTNDVATKHDTASVAVTEAAQRFLYPDFYKLQSMQTWAGTSVEP
ncbi:unnamed protein product [Ascophyllum nodosum]